MHDVDIQLCDSWSEEQRPSNSKCNRRTLCKEYNYGRMETMLTSDQAKHLKQTRSACSDRQSASSHTTWYLPNEVRADVDVTALPTPTASRVQDGVMIMVYDDNYTKAPRCMRDRSCLNKAVCLARLYEVSQLNRFDNHATQHHHGG